MLIGCRQYIGLIEAIVSKVYVAGFNALLYAVAPSAVELFHP